LTYIIAECRLLRVAWTRIKTVEQNFNKLSSPNSASNSAGVEKFIAPEILQSIDCSGFDKSQICTINLRK